MDADPTRSPRRRKARTVVLATFAMAATVAGALLWLANRPAYEWWVSPEIGNSGRRAQILVPRGWQAQISQDAGREANGQRAAYYRIYLVERRPSFLRLLFWQGRNNSGMTINTIQTRARRSSYELQSPMVAGILVDCGPNSF